MLAAALLGAVAVQCGPADGAGFLVVHAPVRAGWDGSPWLVDLRALDADGKPLEGFAVVTTTCGMVNGVSAAEGVQVWLGADEALGVGAGQLRYRCDLSAQACCEGIVWIEATMEGLAGKAPLRLEDPETITDREGSEPSTGTVAGSGSTSGVLGSEQFDGRQVHLWGTLSEGACWLDALADIDQPCKPVVGFSCATSVYTTYDMPVVRPDGRVLYLDHADTAHDIIRVFRSDRFVRDTDSKQWVYPEKPWANDDLIPTPACTGDVDQFRVNPDDGSVLYRCTGVPAYFDSAGKQVLPGGYLLAIGHGGRMLVLDGGKYWIQDRAGNRKPVVHPDAQAWMPSFNASRAGASSGFLILTDEGANGSLWKVSDDGSVKREGFYAPPPAGLSVSGLPVILDRDGRGYAKGYVNGRDVVAKFGLGNESSTVVYDEQDLPQNDWTTTPPRLCVRMHGSALFTGP